MENLDGITIKICNICISIKTFKIFIFFSNFEGIKEIKNVKAFFKKNIILKLRMSECNFIVVIKSHLYKFHPPRIASYFRQINT